MLLMHDLFHLGPVMSGSVANGNIPETIIIGGRDHGNNPGKAAHGNQGIGKTTKRATDGTKVNGSDKRSGRPK
jgi:hypothetical protein